MKMTLLEMVQDILSSMDSDDVNSINDTDEALQVAQTVKTIYYELMTSKEWAHLSKMTTLNSVADSSKPNYLLIPNNTYRVDYVKYDVADNTETRTRYEDMEYLYPDEFLNRQNNLNDDNSEITQITDFDGVKYNIYTDREPRVYTSFDDKYLVFDAYDSVKESTLQGTNSQVRLYSVPTWTTEDNFTPDLPAENFPLFLAEAKSTCFLELKQMLNEKAEFKSRRLSAVASQRGRKRRGLARYPNFGRNAGKSGSFSKSPLFDKS